MDSAAARDLVSHVVAIGKPTEHLPATDLRGTVKQESTVICPCVALLSPAQVP
jgi:hypothetical protein